MPLQIIRADITTLGVDAIVCPTNRHLLPGSGIDRVVYEKAGEKFTDECMAVGFLSEGSATALDACDLPSKYVIMTVGPHWNGGDWGELDVLESAYRSSLDCVRSLSLSSVAVPLISAGYYGVPDYLSLRTATDTIREFLSSYEADVYIVVYNRLAFDLSKGIFRDVAEYIGDEEVSKWERGLGRSRCTPRPREGRLVDEANSVHVLKDIPSSGGLLFQHEGNPPLCDNLHPEKIGIIGGAEDGIEIETDESAEGGDEKAALFAPVCESISPDELRKLRKLDGFSDYLVNKILEEGKTGVEVYKKANISHKLFSKIMCDSNYKPSRDTALAFALALELPYPEFTDMLSRAGFALSPADKRDLVIRYFVENGFYDVLKINEALFALDLVPLGYRK